MKKILAVILALCMLFSVNVVAFAQNSAEETYVQFWANDAVLQVTNPEESVGPVAHELSYYVSIESGKSLSDCGITISDPELNSDEDAFYGWKVMEMVENTWVPLNGVGILDTGEVLEYKVSGAGVQFYAVYFSTYDEYYSTVVIDAYEGEFTYKDAYFDDDEPTSMWMNTPEEGLTLKDCEDTQLVIKTDPVREGYTFEGWLEYDDTNDCFNSYNVYTTEQIVNEFPVPDYDVWYIAKYAEITMDEYNEYVEEQEYEFSTIVLDANGGKVEVSATLEEYDYSESSSTPVFATDIAEGFSLQGTFDETENMLGIKIGIDFTNGSKVIKDWTVYTAQSITYEYTDHGEIPDVQLADDEIMLLSNADEEFNMDTYVIIKGYQVYDKSMTTKEVLNLAIDQNYYAVANWADPIVDEADDKEDSADPVKKSPATGNELMLAPVFVVVIAMAGVVLTFKKSKKEIN